MKYCMISGLARRSRAPCGSRQPIRRSKAISEDLTMSEISSAKELNESSDMSDIWSYIFEGFDD